MRAACPGGVVLTHDDSNDAIGSMFQRRTSSDQEQVFDHSDSDQQQLTCNLQLDGGDDSECSHSLPHPRHDRD